jgi:hypothetical protein
VPVLYLGTCWTTGQWFITLELSCCKFPSASTLPGHWLDNRSVVEDHPGVELLQVPQCQYLPGHWLDISLLMYFLINLELCICFVSFAAGFIILISYWLVLVLAGWTVPSNRFKIAIFAFYLFNRHSKTFQNLNHFYIHFLKSKFIEAYSEIFLIFIQYSCSFKPGI